MPDVLPTLIIRVRPRGGDEAFVFEGAGREVKVGRRERFDQAIFEQESLRDRLEELKKIGGGALRLTADDADEALQQLYDVGRLVWIQLLGDDVAEPVAADLSELIEAALNGARLRDETPWVQVTTADKDPLAYAIPFELLPTRAGPPPRVAEDETRLADALDGFLGFRAVIWRDDGNPFEGGMFARSQGQLPVKLFQNVSLPSALDEMRFFVERPGEYDVDGPWPGADVTDRSFAATLLAQIFDPSRKLDGTARPTPDQVQHFACHCDTFGGSLEHRLILAGDPGRSLPVMLSALVIRQAELAAQGWKASVEKPLVFLNACGAASVDPRRLGSFARFFMLNRNRGFIGAQTMVPDKVARAFAELFYAALVSKAATVGEAVLYARRRLALRHYNMLGLLYMHYGPAELRLAS